WSLAKSGERHLTLLAGEPGVGKTRLAAEFAQIVYAEGAIVLYGRCDEDMEFSYQPFVDALKSFVENKNAESLRLHLGPHPGDLARIYPDLASIVPGLPAPLQSDPEAERYRLFDAVSGWLRATTEDRPLVVILDNLHAAAKPALL